MLISNIEQYVYDIDRESAIGYLMLKYFFGQETEGILSERLDEEIKCITEQRAKQYDDGPFLIFKFTGEASINTKKPSRDFGDYVIAFDAIDKKVIISQYEALIHKVITALFLISEHDFEIKKVTDGIYLKGGGKTYYSYTATGSAKAIVGKKLTVDSIARMQNYLKVLPKVKDLDDIYRLLIRSTSEDKDKLRAFLFAWAALEIFINKTFKEYEDKFMEEHTIEKLTATAKLFFDRITEVMKDKYRLSDKFMVISSLLSKDAEQDLKEFRSLKKIRDSFLHGDKLDENSLPIAPIIMLLRKYLGLHVNRI